MRIVLMVVMLAGGAAWLGAQSLKDIATVRLTKTETIKVQDFEKNLAEFETKTKQTLDATNRRKLLDSMVDNILFHQAAEEEKIYVSEDDVIKYIKQMYQIPPEADLQRLVAQSGVTIKELTDRARPIVEANAYIKKKRPNLVNAKVDVTTADIEKRYNAEIKSFVSQPLIRYQEIFFLTDGKSPDERTKIKGRIDGLARQIKSGGKAVFDDFYGKPSAEKDYITREATIVQGDTSAIQALGESFIDKAFVYKRSQISDVIESSHGYHIIYLIENSPARLYGIDELIPGTQYSGRDQIRQVLTMEKLNELYVAVKAEIATDLRKRADIAVDPKYKW